MEITWRAKHHHLSKIKKFDSLKKIKLKTKLHEGGITKFKGWKLRLSTNFTPIIFKLEKNKCFKMI